MATKTTTRVLVTTAVGALALGLTAPAASAHGGKGDSRDARHEHTNHGHHRGHAWGHANIKTSRVVVDEGAGTATVTLRLSKKAPADATFTWATFDKTPAPAPSAPAQRRSGGKWSDHLAVAGQDYTASSGTVTIAAGTRTATVTVPILDDTAVEKKERFFVRFKATSATKAAARKASKREGTSRAWCAGPRGRATTTVVIADNDTTAPTS